MIRHTSGFAIACVRRDHQEWAKRARILAETNGVRPSAVFATSAFWMVTDGDLGGAIGLLTNGLDEDDEDGSAWAFMVRTAALSGAGRAAEAFALVPGMRAALAGSAPRARFALALGIAQASQGRPDAGPDIDALAEAAHAIGGPNELAHAMRMRAAHRNFVEGDPVGAVADAREAVRLNESVDTTAVWSEVSLVFALLQSGYPDARHELRRVMSSAYDERQWTVIDTLLEPSPLVLVADDPTSAATVFGHVEGRATPWGAIGENTRLMAATAVEAIAGASALRARGAAMDRHQIVAFTLDALAEP